MESKAANFNFFALAIDESTDATDMTPLAIIIRGTDNEYNVTEEMASLVPSKGRKKSFDVDEAVEMALK